MKTENYYSLIQEAEKLETKARKCKDKNSDRFYELLDLASYCRSIAYKLKFNLI